MPILIPNYLLYQGDLLKDECYGTTKCTKVVQHRLQFVNTDLASLVGPE